MAVLCIFQDFEVFVLNGRRRKEQKWEVVKHRDRPETALFPPRSLLDGNANNRTSQERGGGLG